MEKEENNENLELKEESVLLNEYKKLQENTVSKEQYQREVEALKEKNALYLKAITEGKEVDIPKDGDISVEDAINNISNFKGTNLKYWETMTATIDTVLKQTPEQEITRIAGSNGLEEIVKVNQAMKQMVKDSEGDPDYFRTLYKNRVSDSAQKISSEIEKAGGLINYLNKKSK